MHPVATAVLFAAVATFGIKFLIRHVMRRGQETGQLYAMQQRAGGA